MTKVGISLARGSLKRAAKISDWAWQSVARLSDE